MGNRRMISKTVTQTHRFLRLPLEAQALYFHLIQNCDDDGVVEAFPILRMIGANEDNLGLLVIKQFVKPLNDEMVYFVVDFHEQNTVRKDRYIPSIYKELLEENTDETTGKPLVNQTVTTGLPNISKDNESKSNLSKELIDIKIKTKKLVNFLLLLLMTNQILIFSDIIKNESDLLTDIKWKN